MLALNRFQEFKAGAKRTFSAPGADYALAYLLWKDGLTKAKPDGSKLVPNLVMRAQIEAHVNKFLRDAKKGR